MQIMDARGDLEEFPKCPNLSVVLSYVNASLYKAYTL